MTESTIAITTVDSGRDRQVLRGLLIEFHEWMTHYADDSYDPWAELTEDVRSLEREADAWAWLSWFEEAPAGCVLLYGITGELAEFKRLWVRPANRGEGLGQVLTRSVIDEARNRGYETLGLTTPPWAEAAHALYESMGFERTQPYPETRLPEQYHDDAIFMQFDLSGRERTPTDE